MSASGPTQRRNAQDFIERVTLPAEIKPYLGRRAGLVTRVVACVIDCVAIAVILGAMLAGLVGVRFAIRPAHFTWPTIPTWVTAGAPFVVAILYFAVCWQSSGRSVGDQIIGLRVVDRHGRVPRGWLALVRSVMCVFFPIGLGWALISSQNRSIQDLIVRTSVVHDWRTREDFSSPQVMQ